MSLPSIDEETARIWIDQMVANELNEAERMVLIQWLEGSQERWRDLGLAFLEAQVWGNCFAKLESETRVAPSVIAVPVETRRRHKMGVVLLIAASLLFTFFCGFKWAQLNSVDRWANQSAELSGEAGSLAQQSGSLADTVPRPAATSSTSRLQQLTFEIEGYGNSAGTREKIRVPMQAIASIPQAHDRVERVMRSFEDRGFAVKTEQRYLPATLPNGKTVMFPVDRLMASYVGETVY